MQRFSKWHKLLRRILKEGGQPLFLFLETFLHSFGIKLQAMSNQAMSSDQNQLSQMEKIRVVYSKAWFIQHFVCVCACVWLCVRWNDWAGHSAAWSRPYAVQTGIRSRSGCSMTVRRQRSRCRTSRMQSRSRRRMLSRKQRWSSCWEPTGSA